MKESIWRMRKSLVLTLALVFSIVTALATVASPIPMTTLANSETMVYLDPATINGTAVGQEFNVSIMIRDAQDVYGWQAGLIFNASALECTESVTINDTYECDFLKNAGSTQWYAGPVNNTEGVIEAFGCSLLGDYKASGDGTLAYVTFRVKASGVSDLHLLDVMVTDYYDPAKMVPFNIIDVYTVIANSTVHKVVTVSNSTGTEAFEDPITGELVDVHSGFYDHAHNLTLKEISFNVTSLYQSFAKVAVPKTLAVPETLFNASSLGKWSVIIDGKPVSRTVTENATHHLIEFTYSEGIHEVLIITRPLMPSYISIAATPTSVTVGSDITISGAIEPVKQNVTVYIESRTSGTVDGWTLLGTVQTDQNSNYSYTWTTQTPGNYEVRARWEGDIDTEPAESEHISIEVLGKEEGIDPLIIAAAGVVVIIVVAVVVYFVKFRKPEEEE